MRHFLCPTTLSQGHLSLFTSLPHLSLPLNLWRDRGLEDLCTRSVIASTRTNNYKMAMNTFRLEITKSIASTGMIFEQQKNVSADVLPSVLLTLAC